MKSKLQIERKDEWLVNTFFVGAIVRFVALGNCFPYLFTRLFDLFGWSLMLLVPIMLNKIGNKKWKICFTILSIVAFICLFVIQFVIGGNSGIFPYSFASEVRL